MQRRARRRHLRCRAARHAVDDRDVRRRLPHAAEDIDASFDTPKEVLSYGDSGYWNEAKRWRTANGGKLMAFIPVRSDVLSSDLAKDPMNRWMPAYLEALKTAKQELGYQEGAQVEAVDELVEHHLVDRAVDRDGVVAVLRVLDHRARRARKSTASTRSGCRCCARRASRRRRWCRAW